MLALLGLFLFSFSIYIYLTELHSLGLAMATLGCGDILFNSPTTLNCNSPLIFSQGFLQQMPVGAKDIFVQLEMKIEDYCSLAAPYHFYTLSIEPITGTTVKLINVQWNGAKAFTFFSQDGTSIKSAYNAVADQNQPAGQWFSATSWIQLGSNQAFGAFTFYGKAATTSGGAVSYPSTWTIDMNTKIYICSDLNAATSIKCQVANFKVWYQPPTNPINAVMIRDGITPKLIALYKMNQYTGYEVTNSVSSSIGSGYFGSSTASGEDPVSANKPIWVPEEEAGSNKLNKYSGIQFTDTTQYVTLPTFPLGKSLSTPAYSLTVKLWFKVTTPPSTPSYLFKFARSSVNYKPATDIFSLILNANLKCRIQIYGNTVYSTLALSGSNWNSIFMSLTSLDYINLATSTTYPYTYVLMINNALDATNTINLATRYVHESSNIVRLGGPPTPKGIIAGVEIYSPGSNLMTADNPCQPSTCLRDLGVTNPSTCLLPTCATNCLACYDSQDGSCITCAPGFTVYQSKCVSMTCKPGKYLFGGTTCQSCLAGCETCSNGISCDTCKTGFITQGSICVCPFRQVVNNGACHNCIANCQSCSDITTCDTCDSGFIKSSSSICVCPSGSRLNINTCESCIANCQSCSDGVSCNVCNTGLVKQGSVCGCPLGFRLNINTCESCIAYCQSCSDSTSCDVCNTGFVKQGSVCICPPGSVLNSVANTCQSTGQNNNNPSPSCRYPFKMVASGSSGQQCVLDISEEDADQAKQVAQISTAASYATNLGGVLVAILSYNNVGLLLIGSLTEMLSYIQYLKIDYPPKVYQMLQEQDINSGGINIITEIPKEVAEAIPNHPLPEEFAKNDTHSSFVANCWELLISLVCILISIGLISLILSCRNRSRNSKLYSFLSKLLLSLRWNLFLGIFCSGYGFTGIFTALEFRTVNMDSLLSILSFIVSLVINTLGFCLFFFIFHLSMIFRTIKTSVRDPVEQTKQLEETEEKWKSYGVLMEDYKNDFLSQKIFLFIFMFRTYIHYSVLGYLNEHPLIQTCCFTVISICIIAYLIRRRPMKGKMNYIQQMVCEMAILLVNITVVILASMDKWEIHDHDTRVKVGDVIIATNFGLSIAGSAFLVIETLSQIKEAYVFIKTWFRSQKTANIKIRKRNLEKDYKPFNPPQNLETESKLKDLEISDLERSNNNVSVDQLKGPRNLIKGF